jgi:hypothetical protein
MLLLAPCTIPKLEDHFLSAVRDCLFNIFAASLRIWRAFPPSTPEDVVTGTHIILEVNLTPKQKILTYAIIKIKTACFNRFDIADVSLFKCADFRHAVLVFS